MSKNINKSTELIIEKMGYKESDNLFYYDDLYNDERKTGLSHQIIKNLKEIKPYAFYSVDNKPFILFFNNIKDKEKLKKINKKIWNMQIPVVIFDDINCIKIFNGSSLEFDEIQLSLIKEDNISEIDEKNEFSYWNINKKDFWIKYEKAYKNKKLNEFMLENIKYITQKLKNQYKLDFATKLILRVIFIRYLIDKGVDIGYEGFTSDIEKSRERLIEIAKDKEQLYKLFSYLKEKFNGNLFELSSELNDKNLTKDVFLLISSFLSGKEKQCTGQQSLFSMYDFDIIPVSLISNIYEILLGEEKQKADKAFYTPDYLVKYVVEQALDKKQIKERLITLDPSCGSRNIPGRMFQKNIRSKS